MDVLDHIREEHDGFKDKISEIEDAIGNRIKEIFLGLYAETHEYHAAEEVVLLPVLKKRR